jgi:hypothetical protein
MQPGGHGGFAPQRTRFTSQRQKCCLKDILGILPMMQEVQGQVQDHRSLPAQQLGKGIVFAPLCERLKQVAIGRLTAALVGEQAVKGSKQRRRRVRVHDGILTR